MTGNEKTKREHKEPEEMTVDELEKGIDDNSMRIGLTVADIFKTLSLSMLALPSK